MSISSKYVKHTKTIEVGEIKTADTIKEEHIEITDKLQMCRKIQRRKLLRAVGK